MIPWPNHHLHILQGIAATMPRVPVNAAMVLQTVRTFQAAGEVVGIQITVNERIYIYSFWFILYVNLKLLPIATVEEPPGTFHIKCTVADIIIVIAIEGRKLSSLVARE